MPSVDLPKNFNPRSYQLELMSAWDRGCRRGVIVWHRRAGKDKVGLAITSKELYHYPGVYWHLFPLLNQGRKMMWDGRVATANPFSTPSPRRSSAGNSIRT